MGNVCTLSEVFCNKVSNEAERGDHRSRSLMFLCFSALDFCRLLILSSFELRSSNISRAASLFMVALVLQDYVLITSISFAVLFFAQASAAVVGFSEEVIVCGYALVLEYVGLKVRMTRSSIPLRRLGLLVNTTSVCRLLLLPAHKELVAVMHSVVYLGCERCESLLHSHLFELFFR